MSRSTIPAAWFPHLTPVTGGLRAPCGVSLGRNVHGPRRNQRSPMKRSATTTPAPPHEASGHQTLSAYIQARFDEFSRSQKDVAQYIVDHLDEVAFQTAEELARRAN